MKYTFKLWEEAGWASLYAFATFVLTAFLASDGVTNWKTWAITLFIGALRAAVGAALAYLVPKPGGAQTPATPPPAPPPATGS